jgi:hypothetical protein
MNGAYAPRARAGSLESGPANDGGVAKRQTDHREVARASRREIPLSPVFHPENLEGSGGNGPVYSEKRDAAMTKSIASRADGIAIISSMQVI